MKKFIGTKTVIAEPMTKTDAKECDYLINVNNPEQDGYEVTYEDGYKSWSPKTPFDKAYKPISPSNSVVDEYIKSVLRDFIGGDKEFEIFTVWKCKVLQNTKWLMCTNLPDVKYYELTYNGDKRELYIDEYVKENNTVIKNPFELC